MAHTRIALRNLCRFLQAARKDEPIPADHLLRLAERPIGDHIVARHRLSPIRKPLPRPHLTFLHHSIEPDVEIIDRGLNVFLGRVGVPLSAGDYEIFGGRR